MEQAAQTLTALRILLPDRKPLHSVKCSIFTAKETIAPVGTSPTCQLYFVQEKHLFAAMPLKNT